MAIPVTVIQATENPLEWQTLSLVQNKSSTLDVALLSRTGADMGLDSTYTATLGAWEYEGSTEAYFSITCSITEDGSVRVPVLVADLPYAGIWLGQFDISNAAGDVVYKLPCYIEVAPDLSSDTKNHAPISVAEIRMLLRDRADVDNTFLDSVEFSTAEIMICIRRPVDYWNESSPDLDGYSYTAASFPHRHHWADAVIGELLRLAAHNLSRNRTPVQAAGVAMDSKSRADVYLQLSEQYLQEYRQWVSDKKYAISVEQCWGTVTNTDFS